MAITKKEKAKNSNTLAIIKTGGKQYKVKEGQEILIEKINGKDGEKINFSEILLISSDNNMKIGTPFIEGAKVESKILSQEKGPKVIVFKMKPKKRYRRTKGHRQKLTKVKIERISA